MTKTELTVSYVEKWITKGKENGRGYSKRFIATNLYEENTSIFRDLEDARYCVRSVTGARGRKLLKYKDLNDAFLLLGEPEYEVSNPEPYIVPTSIKKTLGIADVHIPFYDKRAFEIAVEYGLKKGCDSVIINGDFMDFYQNSKFDKSPLTVQKCINDRETGQDILKLLQDCFGTVIYKAGNHDKRREDKINTLSATMPELVDLAGSLSNYLFFDGCRVTFVEDYRHIQYGELSWIHGHEYGLGGGIHAAYNLFNKTLDSTMSGHSHIAQSIIKKDIHNHIFGSWKIAALCHLKPRYAPMNGWNNGFAYTEKDSDGNFEVDNRVIYGTKTFSV